MVANGANRSGKLLVVYYSLTGKHRARRVRYRKDDESRCRELCEMRRDSSGKVKGILSAVFRRTIKLGNLRYDPRDYALVVIGSSVCIERMNPAIRTYLKRFSSDLGHVGFFVTSRRTGVAKVLPSVERILGHKVDASTGFASGDLADARALTRISPGFWRRCIVHP